MKKSIAIIIILFLLTGCTATTLPHVRFKNKEKLSKLTFGMSKEEVLRLMPSKPAKVHNSWGDKIGVINNPYKVEVVKIQARVLEILYYYTHIRHSDSVITNDELTPVVFEDGKLIGIGWKFLMKQKED